MAYYIRYWFNFLIISIAPVYFKNKKFSYFNNNDLNKLKSNRIFEPDLLLINQFIKTNDVCFDIGSNNGEYTYLFEKYAGAKNVYSFEPINELNIMLKKLFREVNIFPIAFSSQNAICDFKIPKIKNSLYYSRGKLDLEIVEPNETNFELIKVECRTLDFFVKELSLKKLDFLKIDVEGHELEILKGGEVTLRNFKPIILIEIEQRHHTYDIIQIFDYIKSFGYRTTFFDINTEKFISTSNFQFELNQDYKTIKTVNYVNNFWCFPI